LPLRFVAMSVWKRTASAVPKNAPFIQCCRGYLLPEKSPGRGARRWPTVPPRGMGLRARPLPPLPPSPASAGEGDAIARGSIAPGLPIKSIGTGHALGYTLSALRAWQNGLPAVVILSPSASFRVNSAKNPSIRNAVILSPSSDPSADGKNPSIIRTNCRDPSSVS